MRGGILIKHGWAFFVCLLLEFFSLRFPVFFHSISFPFSLKEFWNYCDKLPLWQQISIFCQSDLKSIDNLNKKSVNMDGKKPEIKLKKLPLATATVTNTLYRALLLVLTFPSLRKTCLFCPWDYGNVCPFFFQLILSKNS